MRHVLEVYHPIKDSKQQIAKPDGLSYLALSRLAHMFREAIEEQLKRKGWTKYRLFKESPVPKSTVYGFLNGNREIESGALEKICDTLDLELRPVDEE